MSYFLIQLLLLCYKFIGSVKHLFMASKIIVFYFRLAEKSVCGDWEILSSLFI